MTLGGKKGARANRLKFKRHTGDKPTEELFEQTMSLMLHSGAPKLLLWSEDLLAFFNDAFQSLDLTMGSDGMGARYDTFRPEVWRVLEPYIMRAWDKEPGIEADLHIVPDSMGDDGAAYGHRCYFAPIIDPGERVRGVLIDICPAPNERGFSERILIENRQMQNLFRESPVMIAYASSDTLKLQFANAAFKNFYGGRNLEGLTVCKAIPEARQQGFLALLQRVIETGEPYVGTGVPVEVHRGQQAVVQYTDFVYHPIKGENDRVAGVLCTAVDVTAKVRAEQDRDNLRHQILHASRVNAMGTVAMTLAHELNQPLAAAANYLHAARRLLEHGLENDNANLSEAIDHAREQIIRAGDIIKRLHPLIRSGEAERQSVAVADAVDRAINLLMATDGFEVSVTKKISSKAGRVLADPIQLEQVLVNLLRNANEASRESARREVVISTRVAKEGGVSISLRDFGRGLPADKIEELAGLNTNGGGEGLGVGLVLSRTLIEANGGSLRADNAPRGQAGAIFTFNLEQAPAND